jgi:formylmethanofuran dehydrogenase subunit E
MKLGEKVSYLKGLMDGYEIDQNTKEGKLLALMADILSEMSDYFDDVQDQIDEIVEVVDAIDDSLCDIEDDIYGDEDADDSYDDEDYTDSFDDDDEELYEVCCPTCGDSIQLNESMLEEGEMICPNCGEHLEFDLDDEDDIIE